MAGRKNKYNIEVLKLKIDDVFNNNPNKIIKLKDLERETNIGKHIWRDNKELSDYINKKNNKIINSYLFDRQNLKEIIDINLNNPEVLEEEIYSFIVKLLKENTIKERFKEIKSLYDYCIENNKEYLLEEWDYTKNGQVVPKNVSYGSAKRVWWVCSKNHKYCISVKDAITRTKRCPYCFDKNEENNKKSLYTYSIENNMNSLVKEWHPVKNGMLTPYDVTFNSNKKVWWKCSNGHEWEATVCSRNTGNSCPYCSNKKVCTDNCLATVNPKLAKEWHPTKNGTLTPYDVTCKSAKKVWWICKEGHEWEDTINNRTKGKSCPYCFNRNEGDINEYGN